MNLAPAKNHVFRVKYTKQRMEKTLKDRKNVPDAIFKVSAAHYVAKFQKVTAKCKHVHFGLHL